MCVCVCVCVCVVVVVGSACGPCMQVRLGGGGGCVRAAARRERAAARGRRLRAQPVPHTSTPPPLPLLWTDECTPHCTYARRGGTHACPCAPRQVLNVTAQLDAGIRFIDFRTWCGGGGGAFWGWHTRLERTWANRLRARRYTASAGAPADGPHDWCVCVRAERARMPRARLRCEQRLCCRRPPHLRVVSARSSTCVCTRVGLGARRYGIHFMQTVSPSIGYLSAARAWLDAHPTEV